MDDLVDRQLHTSDMLCFDKEKESISIFYYS